MSLKLASTDTSEQSRSDPSRESLRQKIDELAEATRLAERAHSAVTKAQALVASLDTEHANAVAAVARAREHQGRRAAAAIAAGHAMPASTTRAARNRELEIEDERDSAQVALQALIEQAAAADEEKTRAELHVGAAINAILAHEAVRLVDELEKLKLEIADRQSVLYFIGNRGSIPHGNYMHQVSELSAPLAKIEPKITEAMEVGLIFDHVFAEQNPIVERWAAACVVLRRDADAPLPA